MSPQSASPDAGGVVRGAAASHSTRSSSFPALGSTATVVTVTDATGRGDDPDTDHRLAVEAVGAEVSLIDAAASRFRDDSEISAVSRAGGRPVEVSELFLDATEAALRAARVTGGLVDPTIGRALRILGYDRDFPLIAGSTAPPGPHPPTFFARAVPGWTAVVVDRRARTVRVPVGVELDFGATAKALCADRAAARAVQAMGAGPGCGVLVSLGGDIAVGGAAPAGGWPIGLAASHADPLDPDGPAVAVHGGGLATSSTAVRRWSRGGRDLHHIVNPATGAPAEEVWVSASVAAGSCLDANIASTAAVLLGREAPEWLRRRALPSRLVHIDGRVVTVAGWPHPPADRAAAAGGGSHPRSTPAAVVSR